MFTVVAKEKPRWYQFRWKLSNFFVRIARRIYPENPEVTAFYMQTMTDQLIYGQSIVSIGPEEIRVPNAKLSDTGQ
jgi:hypothetical protein